MEGMIADTPGNCTLLVRGGTLVGLAFDTEVHDMVSADSTVVNDNIPGPQSNSVPLLHLEPLLAITCTL